MIATGNVGNTRSHFLLPTRLPMEFKETTFLAPNTPEQLHALRHLLFHDILTLDSAQNTLTWWPEHKIIPLNEAQKRFFSCLLLRITLKRQIIATVCGMRAIRALATTMTISYFSKAGRC